MLFRSVERFLYISQTLFLICFSSESDEDQDAPMKITVLYIDGAQTDIHVRWINSVPSLVPEDER